MPSQTQFAYDISIDIDSLSSIDTVTTLSNTVITEVDSLNHEWSASRSTNNNYIYKIRYAKTSQTSWFNKVYKRLNYLLNLPINWDTYGANKIDFTSIIYAFEIIEELINKDIPEPSIVPINDGGIQLEWHINNSNLEISIQSDRTIGYYSYHDQNDFEEKESEFRFYGIQFSEDFIQCINIFLEHVEKQ